MIQAVGIGARGHAKVMIEALRLAGEFEIVALVDPDRELWGTTVLGVSVAGGDSLLPDFFRRGVHYAFLGVGSVGDSRRRRELYERLTADGFHMASTVHPAAVLSPSAQLAEGATVLAGAIVGADATLGINVLVNTAAVVEHDCKIGDHVHIATGAKIGGGVIVEQGSHIGLGASVRHGIRIGANAIVGAGAVVVKDVEPDTMVVGVPARIRS